MNKCKICQTETENKIYCSMKCRDVSRNSVAWIKVPCKICGKEISCYNKRRKIYCSNKCAGMCSELTKKKSDGLLEYRIENPLDVERMLCATKKTNQKRYGVDWSFQAHGVKEKIKQTNFDVRGVEYPTQCSDVIKKQRETFQKKYGGYTFKSEMLNAKAKNTTLIKYGVENAMQNKDIQQKMKLTNVEKYGIDTPLKDTKKKEAGMLKKYGVKNISKSEDNKKVVSELLLNKTRDGIFNGTRLGESEPLFSRDDYTGVEYYKIYKFKCKACKNEYEDILYGGNIPRCNICHPRSISTEQEELEKFIKSIYSESSVIRNDRKTLNGLELDIYIPDKNLAVEYNGVYWHGEISGNKPKNYHLNKLNECAKKGIQLIHIFDQEWEEKQDIIKSIIAAKLKKTDTIYARNLLIKEVSNSDKELFLEKNHVQGADISSVRFGLYNKDNELISIMTFCKSRYDKKVEWEISRFCTKLNIRVVGGASRLFSHFIKTYNPPSIVSYSDKRLFTGKIYETLGMKRCDDSPPSYYYIKTGRIIGNRITFQKHKLKKILPIFDETLSEWKNMQNSGFDRIWDCGNLKYVWRKPQ